MNSIYSNKLFTKHASMHIANSHNRSSCIYLYAMSEVIPNPKNKANPYKCMYSSVLLKPIFVSNFRYKLPQVVSFVDDEIKRVYTHDLSDGIENMKTVTVTGEFILTVTNFSVTTLWVFWSCLCPFFGFWPS